MEFKRRDFILSGVLAGVSASMLNKLDMSAYAQTETPATARENIPLWPDGTIPGETGAPASDKSPEKVTDKGSVINVTMPRLNVYRPVTPNGCAAMVISGGGYAHIELGKESTPTSLWLQAQGITAFELIYRLPSESWSADAPFQDAQRAMLIIRSKAALYGLDVERIGIIGFSAGGHLAGMTAATPLVQRYPSVDAMDQVSSRPDFAALIYPVLTFMPPFDHTHARRQIVGNHPTADQSAAMSVDHQVTAQMPPVFLAQAMDDPIAPVDNSILMQAALRKAGVPVEMHLFQSGKHGWGLGKAGSPVHTWPELFQRWAALNQFIKT